MGAPLLEIWGPLSLLLDHFSNLWAPLTETIGSPSALQIEGSILILNRPRVFYMQSNRDREWIGSNGLDCKILYFLINS